jgi:hypothetical protein
MKRLTKLFTIAILLLLSTDLYAWRETGHFAACEIGYQMAKPSTRAELDKLFPGGSFSQNCTWPDIVRKSNEFKFTAPWHFINRDKGEEYFDPKLLDLNGDVLQALLLADKNLTDSTTSMDQRRFWLRILGHMTGDSHQPLHVGFKSDFGGNTIKQNDAFWYPGKQFTSDKMFPYVEIIRTTTQSSDCKGSGEKIHKATGECVILIPSPKPISLHKVWDQHMLLEFIREKGLKPLPGDSEFLHKAYARAIERKTSSSQTLKLKYSIYSDWVFESRSFLDQVNNLNMPVGAYYKANINLINTRIWMAGRRLAFALDRLVGGFVDNSNRGKFMVKRLQELKNRMNQLRQEAEAIN